MKEPTISPSSSADFFITPSFLSTLRLLSKGHSLLILIKLLIPISDNPWSISCTLSYAKLVVVSSLPKRHLVFEASNVIIHCWVVGWNQNNLDRSPWTCHCKVITILYGALPTAASLNFVIYCFVSIFKSEFSIMHTMLSTLLKIASKRISTNHQLQVKVKWLRFSPFFLSLSVQIESVFADVCTFELSKITR